MYPIIASSIIAFAVVVERSFVILSRSRPINQSVVDELLDYMGQGLSDNARDLLKTESSILAEFLLSIFDQPDESHREKAASFAGNEILFTLRRRLSILSALGSIVPLMGLLGTVLGMIEVFKEVSVLGGTADASLLASGIWEALLTTAAGMAVAIPSLLAYHFLNRRISEFAHLMKRQGAALIASIESHSVSESVK